MSPQRLYLHIKNNRSGEEVFRMTLQRYRAAARRNPAVAARVKAKIDFDLDNFETSIAKAHALVTWDLPTADLARRAPNLRLIHIIGAGVEHLQPLDWLPPGVTLTNNRGVHAEKAGEYGIMALLMLNNALPYLMTQQRKKTYVESFTSAIGGKTLLVLGAGQMGSAVARQAKRFGLEVIGIRRSPRRTAGYHEVHGLAALDRLLPKADFLLVTVPTTPETRGLIDARRLALMKPSAGLINMGRAPVVDYKALAAALRAGTLGGAVLDVFDPEPLPKSSPLWNVPNLVMTPHTSSDDLLSYTPMTLDLVLENLGRLLDGKPLKNRVRPKLGY